jgi:AraC-like DNA-binding protein
VFNVIEAQALEGAPSSEVQLRLAGRFALSGARTSSLRLARSPAAGRLDGFAVHLVGADRLEGLMGPRPVAARAGDLVFYDLAESADLTLDRAPSDKPDLMLWLSRARLPRPLADREPLHGLTISGQTPAGAMIGAAFAALSAQSARASDREFDATAEGLLALIAAASAPILATQQPPPLASLLAIRRHIDKNLQAPGLDATNLARTFGLSRASLYRLFEPVGGVAGYIRAARLRRAYQEIADSAQANRRIGPIAYGLGFRNVSAFNRLFRKQFGLSPGDLRKGRAPAKPAPAAKGTLAEWLARAAVSPPPSA